MRRPDWHESADCAEGPEECVCGEPNSTNDGEWSCPEAPGFCSLRCEREYVADQRFHDQALYLDTATTAS